MAYSYHYTVATYVDWHTAAYASQDLSIQSQNITVIESNPNFPNLILTYSENNGNATKPTSPTVGVATTAKNSMIIEPNFQILYAFRVYMYDDGTNGNGAAKFYWLGSKSKSSTTINGKNANIVDNVKITVANTGNMWPAGVANGTGTTYYGGYQITNGGTTNITSQNTNGDVFKVTVSPKSTNWSMYNAVTFNANIINNNQFYDTNPNAQHPTLLGICPGFNVSTKRTTPPIPASMTTAITTVTSIVDNGGWPYYGYLYYDYCGQYAGTLKPQWVGIKIGANSASSNAYVSNATYNYTVYISDINGSTPKAIETVVSEKISSSASSSGYMAGPKLSAVLAKARLAVLANCNNTGDTNPPGGGGGVGGNPGVTVAPSEEERYNPPPHIGARDISYGQRMMHSNAIVKDPDALGAYYEAMAEPAIKPIQIGYNGENKRTAGLGRIIQDAQGAKSLNTNPDNLTFDSKTYTGSKLWGFRFMYNPTTINYSTAADTSIDWTLGRKDPSVLLAGNQSVTVQLYINRIPDMAYLREYLSNSHTGSVPLDQAYGYKIGEKAIQGILNRGTEYDIEYLYRVLNGDPLKSSLLFGSSYNEPTSDFGYTTAMPCWMHLNDNMRYFGSVANVSVNHVMFNLDMVPILSTVTIGFTRYPALWNGTLFAKQGGANSVVKNQTAQSAAQNTTGTATTPPKSPG